MDLFAGDEWVAKQSTGSPGQREASHFADTLAYTAKSAMIAQPFGAGNADLRGKYFTLMASSWVSESLT